MMSCLGRMTEKKEWGERRKARELHGMHEESVQSEIDNLSIPIQNDSSLTLYSEIHCLKFFAGSMFVKFL